jgi:phosphoribosylanthranilate isomerase
MKTRVKICGITNRKDAFLAAELGAFAPGFVFYRGSKRCVTPGETRRIVASLPSSIVTIGVFVEEKPAEIMEAKRYCGLDRVQVYDAGKWAAAGYDGDTIIAAYRVSSKEDIERANSLPYLPLFDTGIPGTWGGNGKRFDWTMLEGFGRPYVLAGGITADNIDEALRLGPFAVDISSGVEISPGKKDPKKLRALFERIEARTR